MSHSPVILITGAARRVGAQIARSVHAAGASVVLHHRASAAAAQQLKQELEGQRADSTLLVGADLRDVDALAAMVATTIERCGRLDAVVNNASSFFATPLAQINEAVWDDLIGSNLKGPLFLCQAAAPHLQESAGCIVNITDVHAERPLAGYPLYCAAKAGLLGLTRSLALELAPQVRVNAVAPGAIAWPENDDDFPPAERAAIIDHCPLKRCGDPSDIAAAVKFLIFDAPYVTGQVINVDGGRTARL